MWTFSDYICSYWRWEHLHIIKSHEVYIIIYVTSHRRDQRPWKRIRYCQVNYSLINLQVLCQNPVEYISSSLLIHLNLYGLDVLLKLHLLNLYTESLTVLQDKFLILLLIVSYESMSRMVICMNEIQIYGVAYVYKPVGSLLFLFFKEDQRIYSVFFILSYNSGSGTCERYNILRYIHLNRPNLMYDFSYHSNAELHNYYTTISHDVIMLT